MTTERPEGHGTYIVIDESSGSVITDHPGSHILFANRCRGGCTITPGFPDDSRANRSSIVNTTSNISEYQYGDASWDAMMECLRGLYEPFDVQVTDVDPGPDTPHFEAIVAGTPGQAGQPGGVLGVAPFSCDVIENAITFTFANVAGNNPTLICEVVGQEAAHAFGLDHLLNCLDPMTYLSDCGPKSYQDTDSQCGEFSARNCQCGGSTQNSFQHLMNIFGPRILPTPPEVSIVSPRDGDFVKLGFDVVVEASDNVGVENVQVWVNGDSIGSSSQPPYSFRGPVDLVEGDMITIEAMATDDRGDTSTDTVQVLVGEPCYVPADCATGEACVDGRCVPFEVEGGLGDDCTEDADCLSGICVEEYGVCTETCDPTDDGCPVGFDCTRVTGGGGACFHADAGCGCRLSHRSGTNPLAPLALLALVCVMRRRRTS